MSKTATIRKEDLTEYQGPHGCSVLALSLIASSRFPFKPVSPQEMVVLPSNPRVFSPELGLERKH